MKRLSDRDTADHVTRLAFALRLGPVILVFLLVIEWAFYRSALLWLLFPDLAATALIVLGAHAIFDLIARTAGSALFPSGSGTPAPRGYSEQEALVIRGRFVEAADSYRAVIIDEPENIDARLRLARLLERECADAAGAEAEYLEIRAHDLTAHQDWIVSNALIDMYEKAGSRGQLRFELARLIGRFRDAKTAESARRRLSELDETGEQVAGRPAAP